jgi:GcrA cell cycle regulator
MQSTWEDAHSVALRELVEKGLSFAEIARSLNQRFGTAYSRNAAIGRARRLGLSTPKPAGSSGVFATMRKPDARKICEKRARILAKPAPGLASPGLTAPGLTVPGLNVPGPATPRLSTLARAAVLKLRCVAITPRHLALIDLEPGDCRYPYGGDAEGEPITFCGHPRREGSSYCASHFHLTSLPDVAGERGPARAPLRLVEAA